MRNENDIPDWLDLGEPSYEESLDFNDQQEFLFML